MKRIKAIVFDMDGVLVDTENTYHNELMGFFCARGVRRPESDYFDLIGCSEEYFTARMDEWWAQTPIKMEEEKHLSASEALDRWMKSNSVDYASLLNPGVRETVIALQARGLRTAVASCTNREGIRHVLGASGIYELFDPVLSGEDVFSSKPSPDIYLAACASMGLSPAECIAVEDSDRGIAAALAAGMRVVVKRESRFGFSQRGGSWYIESIPELLAIVDADH